MQNCSQNQRTLAIYWKQPIYYLNFPSYPESELCARAHHMTCFGILKWRGPRRNRQTNSSIVALTPARSQQIQKWIPTERFRIHLQVGNYTILLWTSGEMDVTLLIAHVLNGRSKNHSSIFDKDNSVQEACSKCLAVHISKFEILQITWKRWKKEHKTLSFLLIDLAFWCFCFVSSCDLQNFKF